MVLQRTTALPRPLWTGWRLLGAPRHYSKLLVMLLYQAAVLHLVCFISMAIIIAGLDWSSRNIFPEIIAEFMKPGQSVQAAFEAMRVRLESVSNASELRIASLLVGMV